MPARTAGDVSAQVAPRSATRGGVKTKGSDTERGTLHLHGHAAVSFATKYPVAAGVRVIPELLFFLVMMPRYARREARSVKCNGVKPELHTADSESPTAHR